MIHEFDEHEGWGGGFKSCAHWLNWRTGLAMGAAREKVRVARVLAELPQLSAEMRRGALSYSKVRALTRIATPSNEVTLLDFARCATAAHVERLVRAWRRVDRIAEAEDDQRRHASRHLETWPAGTSRRLACDTATVVMRHHADGTVLDVGRKTRTIPPAIRRALTARDHRCRFPGCSCRHGDAHHVRHWAAGGATKLDNLLLLCRRHHRAVHEEGFTVALTDDGDARFFWPDGRPFPDAPPAPRWAGAALDPTSSPGRRRHHDRWRHGDPRLVRRTSRSALGHPDPSSARI